jgi:NADH:ubiquinone oxidoreductase subunit 3 (subunit A)
MCIDTVVDLVFFFFLKNTLVISILFWLLTEGGNIFFDRIEYKNREDFYECGFKTTSDLNFNLNYSFFISAIFLILYDIELVLLIPFLFNYNIMSNASFFSFFFFVIIIFLTFVADVLTNTIE